MYHEDGPEINGGAAVVWAICGIVLSVLLMSSCSAKALEIEPADEGIGLTAAIDLADTSKWRSIADQPWYRVPDKALSVYLIDPVKRNPWKTVGGAAVAIIGWRAAEGKLDDDLKRMGEDIGIYKRRKPEAIKPQAELIDGFAVTTHGDNSPVEIVTEADNVSVVTYGDNSPVDISEPVLLPAGDQ